MLRLLALCGSLRARSSNKSLLEAAALLAPDGTTVELYPSLGILPHFNPDLDRVGDVRPPAVADLCDAVGRADGLIVSSPEYAHGIPGVMKNALDWMVSGPEFVGKPIALLSPSPDSIYVHQSLVEIMTTMSGIVVTEASISLPLRGRAIDAAGIVADLELATSLQNALRSFTERIESLSLQ